MRPSRQTGLRPLAALPPKAKLFLAVAGLAILGFVVWLAVRVLQSDGRTLAIVLIVLSCIGGLVVGSAVVTLTRMLFSLRALPYLLGRGLRRLLSGR